MPTSLVTHETDRGNLFTARGNLGTASAIFTNLNSSEISPELLNATEAVAQRMRELAATASDIVATVHPDHVRNKIAEAVANMLATLFARWIAAGRAERRAIEEAWQRLVSPDDAPKNGVRSDFRRALLGATVKDRLTLLGKKANPEMLAAAVEVLDMLELPEAFEADVVRRHVVEQVIRRHIVSADAGRQSTPDEPFAVGVDRQKVTRLAEGLLEAHRARVSAVADIEGTVRRVVAVLAVLSERSGSDAWELVTR